MKVHLSKWFVAIFALFLITGCSSANINSSTSNASGSVEEVNGDQEEEKTEVSTVADGENESGEENSSMEEDETEEETTTEANPRDGPLEPLIVHYIDVGQANSVLFEYSNEGEQYYILYDTGDFNSNNVVNYLNTQNVSHLDIVIVSHPHADHIGQLDKILEKYEVSEVWMSGDTATSQVFQRAITAIDNSGADYHEPRSGEEYDIGPLELLVINPTNINGDLNNGSVSMKVTYGDIKFIFTGDSEAKREREMLNRGFDLSANILQLGHHGSETSTVQEFLKAVNPEVGIYSSGSGNQYNHPSESVISRVLDYGTEVYGTDVHGTIVVETDGSAYQIKTNKDGTISPPSTGSGNTTETEEPKETSVEEPKEESPPLSSAGCVDINHASIEEVQEIIHIGPARAEDLIELRPYISIEGLTKIKGIGPARIKDMQEQGLACVGE
ncbi:MBL fold metallo-hydrolase [Sutcliffiella horikoshii]|uniref:MBL fold metallo-hydrolase n=1 Tax=Sutcliffiella horikoshii TaxID=79883 RepID=UPI002040C5B9|nr:MBL fold metallo-hydrolase [Sutcliffiella horikoshii]MCM3619644.1 MBL fold metallo-hydrolase [Sutcliffiella horikoshii]